MNVLYEVKEHIAVITINRPEALNALNLDVLCELDEAVTKARDDGEVRALIVTGAGKAFVAGADVRSMKDFTSGEALVFSEFGNRVFMRLESLPKPVIAAVNGYALGGGCELSLACDVRIAGECAKFGQPEVSLGVTPGFGGTFRLPRTVGTAKAKELIFTARIIDATEALSIGLVNAVVPDALLFAAAFDMAGRIAAYPPFAVSRCKASVNMGAGCDAAAGAAFESSVFALCFSEEEQKTLMTAFSDKSKK